MINPAETMKAFEALDERYVRLKERNVRLARDRAELLVAAKATLSEWEHGGSKIGQALAVLEAAISKAEGQVS
jgi:hypothetical protein